MGGITGVVELDGLSVVLEVGGETTGVELLDTGALLVVGLETKLVDTTEVELHGVVV